MERNIQKHGSKNQDPHRLIVACGIADLFLGIQQGPWRAKKLVSEFNVSCRWAAELQIAQKRKNNGGRYWYCIHSTGFEVRNQQHTSSPTFFRMYWATKGNAPNYVLRCQGKICLWSSLVCCRAVPLFARRWTKWCVSGCLQSPDFRQVGENHPKCLMSHLLSPWYQDGLIILNIMMLGWINIYIYIYICVTCE